MEFRILGPLDVRSADGEEVLVSRPRHRAVLCTLLLHAGTPVPRSVLSAALWGTDPPTDPGAALRSSLYGLRKALGSQARVQTGHAGYSFELRRDDFLDLRSFRALRAEAEQALSTATTR